MFCPPGLVALRIDRKRRWPLWASVMLTAVLLTFVLNRYADPAVMSGTDLSWMLVFMAGFGLWLWLAARTFLLLNLSITLDALGGRNRAAIWAGSGALLGAGLIYCGGNVGSGDEAVTTVISALLGYFVWYGSWILLEALSGISEHIAVEREVGAGARLGLLLAVNGAILGWAVAGDWASWSGTLIDLARKGWPALALAIAMALTEKAIQKARQ